MGASHQNTQINMSTDFPALANMTFAELEKIEKDSEEISRMVDESDIVSVCLIRNVSLVKFIFECNFHTRTSGKETVERQRGTDDKDQKSCRIQPFARAPS